MGDVVNEHKRSSIDIEKPSASSDGKSDKIDYLSKLMLELGSALGLRYSMDFSILSKKLLKDSYTDVDELYLVKKKINQIS